MRVTCITALLAVLTATSAFGQGWIEPIPGRPMWQITKVRTDVSIRIEGRIAHVHVDEWFRNAGGGLGEGDYLYPLPGEAVFGNFSLFQGEEELLGEMMDADRARQIYEEIVRRQRDPALIELAGHGLIRARVFPIGPGETRKITLRYTQVLTRAGDALRLRYAAGRRTATALPVASRHPGAAEMVPVAATIVADAAAFNDPFSPTHQLTTTRSGDRITVRPQDLATGDFVCFFPLARDVVGLTLVTHRPNDREDGYFMLTLSPGEAQGPVAPRDITAVVDVSGSMSGSKMLQAQAALRQLLASLRPEDRFRLISFSSGVTTYRNDWTHATAEQIREAERWVDQLRASGGTNIADALDEAFRVSSAESRLPIVVFLTDGVPTVSERDPERIAKQAEARRGRSRVFAFGVGHDVNTYLLDRLSAAGRGATEYVEPSEDVEAALGQLSAKIHHPVLTDLTLNAPVRITEVYPGPLPDLFRGEELVIFGRYAPGTSRGGFEIAVAGRRAGGTERFAIRAEFPREASGDDFIPRLWAARKIGALQQRVRLEGHNAELIEEIRRTALRYGILSAYTAYLVQEPVDVATGGRVEVRPMETSARAMSPSASVGAGAVARSREEARQRDVRSMAELDAADRNLAGRNVRVVAGRTFVHRNGTWTDALHGDSLTVITVDPFSAAYFELVRRLPELKPYLSAFEEVTIAGARLSLRVARGGESGTAIVDRVVRGFRGR